MSAIGRDVSRLSGYTPALPTPFNDDDSIDLDGFARFCELQIANGAAALVVCGTTGEAPTLSEAEHGELVRVAVAAARGRVPVIAGAGCNATAHAIELSRDAEANGADAVLSVVPYYNKPTQEGLYAHFSTIAGSIGLPVILYDVPSRTARALADETIARLAELPRIIGLKDASGDVTRLSKLRPLLGTDFRIFSGDDATAPAFLGQGGDGCISVCSNVAPDLCRSMFLALRRGPITQAQRLAIPVAQLTAALFRETNPVPLKYALSVFGLMSPRVRLPLVELGAQAKTETAQVLARLCDTHGEWMIGKIGGPVRSRRAAAG
jgi:4-hydroxy-tetrahydrodipicolinate synthase